ncbi:hypothetical protein BC828DRAFT_419639 [Blastocladiella britannica]|nr:hypothetical protein BC828DRAFT_419639 [Blastocladiella britannica]
MPPPASTSTPASAATGAARGPLMVRIPLGSVPTAARPPLPFTVPPPPPATVPSPPPQKALSLFRSHPYKFQGEDVPEYGRPIIIPSTPATADEPRMPGMFQCRVCPNDEVLGHAEPKLVLIGSWPAHIRCGAHLKSIRNRVRSLAPETSMAPPPPFSAPPAESDLLDRSSYAPFYDVEVDKEGNTSDDDGRSASSHDDDDQNDDDDACDPMDVDRAADNDGLDLDRTQPGPPRDETPFKFGDDSPRPAWHPFPSRLHALLHLLYNTNPAFTRALRQQTHTILEMIGIEGLPSLSSIEALCNTLPLPKVQEFTAAHSPFSAILPSETTKHIIALPDVYKHLLASQYPSGRAAAVMSDFKDSPRACMLNRKLKATSVRLCGRLALQHVYIGDFVRLQDDQTIWRVSDMYTSRRNCQTVHLALQPCETVSLDFVPTVALHDTAVPEAYLPGHIVAIVPVCHYLLNYLLLTDAHANNVIISEIIFTNRSTRKLSLAESEQLVANHPARILAERVAKTHELSNVPVLVAYLSLWADGMGGSSSGRHSPFEVWQFEIANLPHKFNARPSNVRFITAAKGVPTLEIARIVVKDIKENLEQGILCVAPDGSPVVVTGALAYFQGDTPQFSELAAMMGHTSSYPCRNCEYLATSKSDFAKPGTRRT